MILLMDYLVETGYQPPSKESLQQSLERPKKASTKEMMSNANAFNREVVVHRIKELQARGYTLAITNGHFAFMTEGHARTLEATREVAQQTRTDHNEDAIIVLAIVNNDHQTAAKDPLNAALTERQRAFSVFECRHSDEVFISEAKPGDSTLVSDFDYLLKQRVINPNTIYVKGGDYDTSSNVPPEAQIVQQNGGKFIVIPREGDSSSTNIRNAIRNSLVK